MGTCLLSPAFAGDGKHPPAIAINTAPLPVTGLTVSMNKGSSQSVDTKVTFSAAATGASGNYEYYFAVRDPVTGAWSIGQAYSRKPTWIWDTTGLRPGTYSIQVWARSVGSPAAYEAYREIFYALAYTPDSSHQWHMRAAMSDGRIVLSWQPQNDSRIKQLRIYRSSAPTDPAGKTIARLQSSAHEFSDIVPNWTPYFYWVQAFDSDGKALGVSTKAAAFAHPATSPSERVETFAFWYEPYKPTMDTDRSLRHIGNAAFVVGPGAGVAADLSKVGMGVLPYITLYQTSGWAGTFPENMDFTSVVEKIAPTAFYLENISFPGTPPGFVPTKFCRPGSIEYNARAIQYTTCPNSAPFRDMVLAEVRKQVAGGAFGFFVDNGYQDDVAASSVCQSTRHSHYYGANLTSADAFLGMLMEITCTLKKLNPHGIVMVNGGVPGRAEFYGLKLGDVCDGQLWESYLRSSYSTPKEHVYDWHTVYRRSVELEKDWHATPPRRMFVLSYPWNREEAFFCFATAKLCDLPWSAGLGINDPDHKQFGGHFGTYPELVNLKLGSPTNVRQYGGEKLGEVYVRRFERGVVVVNPTKKAQKVTLSLLGRKQYRDMFAKKDLSGEMIVVAMPPESGRVYLYK
jgi:hypothetical protein